MAGVGLRVVVVVVNSEHSTPEMRNDLGARSDVTLNGQLEDRTRSETANACEEKKKAHEG